MKKEEAKTIGIVTQALDTTRYAKVLSMNACRWYFLRRGDVE